MIGQFSRPHFSVRQNKLKISPSVAKMSLEENLETYLKEKYLNPNPNPKHLPLFEGTHYKLRTEFSPLIYGPSGKREEIAFSRCGSGGW